MQERMFEFVIPRDKRECAFVGLDADGASFVFPCRYLPADADIKTMQTEARRLTALIKRVQKEYLYGGSASESFQFYSMTWLVRDFIDNGYYSERERVVRKGTRGRVDWKRTIKDGDILFDGGNIVYKEFFSVGHERAQGSVIAQIYKFCLSFSADKVGFLYGVTATEKSVFNSSAAGYMCFVLQRELGVTFNSYKKILLSHMLTVLKGMLGKMRAVSLAVSDKEFEYAFEHLVLNVFGTEDVLEHYTRCSYEIDGREYAASSMRPDAVMRAENEKPDFYVVDAKYYNYGYTGRKSDLPQSSAVVKQIAYNAYLGSKCGDNGETREFYSVFILPYAMEDDRPVKYVGFARNSASDGAPPDNTDKVAVCLVDLKTLADAYFGVGAATKETLRAMLESEVSACFSARATD